VDRNLVALVLGELAFVAFVLWLAVPYFRERARLRSELQRGIVERFASVPEFVAFLETDAGRRFQASLSGRPLVPLARILGAVQVGVVLVALALGLAGSFVLLGDRDLAVAGMVVLSLGVGFLAAAYASHRLCRRWGLVPGAPVEAARPDA
jgi:hypothetical protein